METYIDWMKSCYYVTVTGLPAASVPCGSTPEDLPVGVQIAGRHGDDFGGASWPTPRRGTGFWTHHPPLSRDARL
jgi:amidase